MANDYLACPAMCVCSLSCARCGGGCWGHSLSDSSQSRPRPSRVGAGEVRRARGEPYYLIGARCLSAARIRTQQAGSFAGR